MNRFNNEEMLREIINDLRNISNFYEFMKIKENSIINQKLYKGILELLVKKKMIILENIYQKQMNIYHNINHKMVIQKDIRIYLIFQMKIFKIIIIKIL